MLDFSDDCFETYIHVPIHPDREPMMNDYYRRVLGFSGEYSEFWVREDGSLRLQFKDVKNIDEINRLGAPSLASIFMPGDFIGLCDRWVRAGAKIELLLLDPVGFTAVVVDPAMNRLEFRGDNNPGNSGVDISAWDFFRSL
ncbi:hypothetical protein QRO11_09535 [Paracidovorax citrulli]|uniref:hypothetical protein n=1 Tax=Paracidovorax citrulli TaxID=80869 RepID=UPI000317B0E0|nr:hypothetical protein [Paracidovorax citrulli]QCX12969.1 hypothetical protein APS58_4281 [Paracidovorax citrulli]UEG48021.1 hypothetical protein LKW27_09295 [Paracidovorax citrulli]UMT88735.1 hypothetical protein FRC90_12100 [Paracidovorax citrulli]UMT96709.1 hypothetical protein FRC97_17875 [Paracidovorax citrulli]WIY36535.1 hypothetical protein QRO11_09535 [Paracidovorax citrulli]